MNRNEPQQVEIFGPASLKKDVNKSIAEFSSVFAQSAVQIVVYLSLQTIENNGFQAKF